MRHQRLAPLLLLWTWGLARGRTLATIVAPPACPLALYTGRLLAVAAVRAEVVDEAHTRVCRLSLRGPGLGLRRPLVGWAHQPHGKSAVLAPAFEDALSRRRVDLDMDSLRVNASHLCIDAHLPLGIGTRTVVLTRRATAATDAARRGFEWPQSSLSPRRRSRWDEGL